MGSRICVKNLPPRLYDYDKVRRIFNHFGEITDVVLPAKDQGKKTGLAFVGFADKESGLTAIKMKNGTFEGTIKLNVSEAKSLGGIKRPAVVDDSAIIQNKRKRIPKEVVEPVKEKAESDPEVLEKIRTTARLMLKNLPHCCSEDNLRELVGDVGTKELRCLFDHKKGTCTGTGYIQFAVPEDAVEMYEKFNQTEFMGRYLKMFPCDDRKELHEDTGTFNAKSLPYVPKSRTDMGSKSWNALFLSGDSVAEVFSKKLDITKADLLSGDSKLAPVVALALAEMRILKEIRAFLVESKVNIYCFEDDVAKSRKVLIIKNLPQDIDADTVKRTFQQFGEIRRFIFNEDIGMTAIIEFNESSAQKAFERMNGSMYKRRPLKLEYAPSNIFDEPPNRELAVSEVVRRIVRIAKEKMSGDGLSINNLIKCTVLLTFTTADIPDSYDLRKVFSKQKNKIIGCGFLPEQSPKAAFILFQDAESAENAEADKKATLAREEVLSVKIADEQSIVAGERTAHKTLAVRNLPFTVKDEEIKTILETVGPIKEVRLPRSMDGKKRGFGFVEFANGGDVHKALELFEGVHFSGRRMVIEISKVKETVKEGKVQKKKKEHLTKKQIGTAIASQRM